mmetsp:Transcript_23613/g.54994  ORF Transcript_23613/g.54994 Transcript_23613/m.54994 type:complete len:373 (-) Transcript_23613:126-1244(-)
MESAPGSAGKDLVWGPHDLGYVAHAMAATQNSSGPLRLACSSFCMQAANWVDVFDVDVGTPEVLRQTARLPHYFPATRVRWLEDPSRGGQDLVVTSGDALRVWSASGELRSLLPQETNPQGVCTPITSVDARSETGATQLASSDVYGFCSLWDVERGMRLQTTDLGQPLSDVAFGPSRLIAASGDRGECFLIDPRTPEDVAVLEMSGSSVSGPSRIAWPKHRSDAIAVAWQTVESCVALHTGFRQTRKLSKHRILGRPGFGAAVADLQWSSVYPEFLCCAKEDGVVEMWHVGAADDLVGAEALQPAFQWDTGRQEACTALALSGKVASQHHLLMLATMPKQPPGGAAEVASASAGRGKLWIAGLPHGRSPRT